MKPVFAIQDIPTGKLNALVKTLMRQMRVNDAAEVVRRINSREWTATEVISYVSQKDGLFHVALPQNQYCGEGSIEELVAMREINVDNRISATYEKRYSEGFPWSDKDRFTRRNFVIVPGTKFCHSQSNSPAVSVSRFKTPEGSGPAVVAASLLDDSRATNAQLYEYARSQGLEPCIHRDAGLLMEHLTEADWNMMGISSIRIMHDHQPVNLIPERFLRSPRPTGPETLEKQVLSLSHRSISVARHGDDSHFYNINTLTTTGFAFYKP